MSQITTNTRIAPINVLNTLPTNLNDNDFIFIQRGIESFKATKNLIRLNSENIDYDNSNSTLTAEDVKDALDELDIALHQIQNSITNLENRLVGTIAAFPSTSAPDGWLECDGSVITPANYQNLVNFLRQSSEFRSGPNNATLPDLRGEFIRGFEPGGSRPIGSFQDHQIARHKHVMSWGERWGGQGIFGHTPHRGYAGSGRTDSDNHLFYTNDGTNTTTAYPSGDNRNNLGTVNPSGLIGNEVRPRNIALLYCIKY